MPIVNLTSGVVPSPHWPELGRFRLGDPKSKNSKGKEVLGRNRKDFRLVWTSPLVADDKQRMAAWNKIMLDLFGENPQVLRGIQFMSSDPDQAFDTWFEQYAGKTILRRCDGQFQTKHWESTDDSAGYSFEPIPCIKDATQPCDCVKRGRLRFWIPAFTYATKVLGTFVMPTGSGRNLEQIWNTLASNAAKGLPIDQVSWVLARREGPTTFASDKGAPSAGTNWFVELSLDEDYIDEAVRRMQARTLGAGSAALEGQAAAELVSGEEFDDEDDYEAVAIEEPEVVYDPAEMIPVMFDTLITEAALRNVYDEAKSLKLAQPDVYAALGVKESPLKEVYYSSKQCINALHLYKDTCLLGGISHDQFLKLLDLKEGDIQGWIVADPGLALQVIDARIAADTTG